jgi:hypothetical protein
MVNMLGEANLPTHAYSGDDSVIAPETITAIRERRLQQAIIFGWQPADLLIIDNWTMAHGRKSFTGKVNCFVLDTLVQQQSSNESLTNATTSTLAQASTNDEHIDDNTNHLITLWREVLEDNSLNQHSDFFDAGSNSLRAISLLQKVNDYCEEWFQYCWNSLHPLNFPPYWYLMAVRRWRAKILIQKLDDRIHN